MRHALLLTLLLLSFPALTAQLDCRGGCWWEIAFFLTANTLKPFISNELAALAAVTPPINAGEPDLERQTEQSAPGSTI